MGAGKNNQNAIKYGKKMVHAITFKMPAQEFERFIIYSGQRCRSEVIRELINNRINDEKAMDTGRR
jgi:metal-responsive CopG/Arc/MetJ family transcriptional regulator